MRRITIVFLVLSLVTTALQLLAGSVEHTSATDAVAGVVQQKLFVENMGASPLTFTENKGQWDDRVQFKTNAGGASMWFTTDGVYYQFT